MPYNIPADHVRYDRLIDRINALAPAFSIHLGDTKSGGTPCTDALILRGKAHFDRFAGALFYTPGDNEWSDCHRPRAGRYDPLERLAFLRRTFFGAPRSLGRAPLPLERQADVMPAFRLYVENATWRHNNIRFATLHIVGGNNNFSHDPAAQAEYRARDEANQAWIAEIAARAQREGALGLVFAFQANLWTLFAPWTETGNGFARTRASLATAAIAFARPVLLLHGDEHMLIIDHPLRDPDGHVLRNVTRVQVMGAHQVHAVRVIVDPAAESLFRFERLHVPENDAR